jgi:hypothetical protein
MSRGENLRRRWVRSGVAGVLASATGRRRRRTGELWDVGAETGGKAGSPGGNAAARPHIPQLEELSSLEIEALKASVVRTVEYRKWKEAPARSDSEVRHTIPAVDALPDEELDALNRALPWGAFLLDGRGRPFVPGRRTNAEPPT